MASPSGALTFAAAHRSRFVAELADLIRFPTVSADPRHARDLERCANWLARHLRSIGLEAVTVVPSPGPPLVLAEWRHAPGRPTVLVYGHYDVQPVDPLGEWRFPPFEPTLRGQDLYGRGASDDKGQLFAHVKALESYLRTAGRLPINVRCLFEGEEEIGSPHLGPFLQRHRRRLSADVAVVSDTRMLAPELPAITYALRGDLGLELEVSGPRRDLHSGVFGGAIHNPLQALCDLVAGLHGAGGRIAIPGFYERVRRWGEGERVAMARSGPTDAQVLQEAAARDGWGEDGYSLYERTTVRPAISVAGIVGGYRGHGVKAVIPSRATAKLDVRLVPDQEPLEIERLLRRHLDHVTPPAVRSSLRRTRVSRPVVIDLGHPALRAAAIAYEKGFGKAPVAIRSGGSIPAVGAIQDVLGVSSVLMGFGLADDGIHAPNERFHLPNFDRGIATSIWFLDEIAREAFEGPAAAARMPAALAEEGRP